MFLAIITVISTPKPLFWQRLIYGDVEGSAGENRKSGKHARKTRRLGFWKRWRSLEKRQKKKPRH